jgi:hypothetical protein
MAALQALTAEGGTKNTSLNLCRVAAMMAPGGDGDYLGMKDAVLNSLSFFLFFCFFCFGDGKYVTEYAESHDDARVLRLVFEAGLQLLQMHGTAYGISIQV